MLEIAQVLNRSITNIIPLEIPTTKKISYPSPDVVKSTSPLDNLSGNAFPKARRLPRVQQPNSPQLPVVQRENPPCVRRSPRQHTQSVQKIPTRATYSITIPDTKSVNPCLQYTSAHLLKKIISNLMPPSPLSSNTSNQQHVDAFLYPTINHIYNDMEKSKQYINCWHHIKRKDGTKHSVTNLVD